jgi:hypothetical protein
LYYPNLVIARFMRAIQFCCSEKWVARIARKNARPGDDGILI